MLSMFGCAGMIGAVFLIFGLIGSLFATDATILERLGIGLMAGVMAFVASLILMSRDMQRSQAAHKRVRKTLLARGDQEEQEFLLQFPRALREVAAGVRSALAAYFDVPVAKIRANDCPAEDYQTEYLTPGFHMFVVGHVAQFQGVELQEWTYRQESEKDMLALVREVRRIVTQGEAKS